MIPASSFTQNCVSWFLLAFFRKPLLCWLIGTLLAEAKVISGVTIKLEDGSLFSGPIKDGKPHGNGTLTDKHGSNYTGTFVGGVKSGFFTVNYSNNSRFEGFYKDDMKNGKGIYAEPCQYNNIRKYNVCYLEWLDSQKNGRGLETFTSQVLENVKIDIDALFKVNPYFELGNNLDDLLPRNDTLNESLGVFYAGEYKNGLYHGHGVRISTLNVFFKLDGEWKNGTINGKGVQTLRFLNVQEPFMTIKGEFKDGTMHGKGIETWSAKCSNSFFYKYRSNAIDYCTDHEGEGQKYEGEFKKGKKSGTGVQTGPDGQKYKGWLINGTQQGVKTWPDGRKYQGQFDSLKMDGQGLMTWPDGRNYQGQWMEGEMLGKGKMIWPDGHKFEGDWKKEDTDAYLEQEKKKLTDKLRFGWKIEDGCICMDKISSYTFTYEEDGEGKQVKKIYSGNKLGYGIMTWLDGSNYTGEWRKNKKEGSEGIRHGYGEMIWADGRKYDGEWYKDQMEGSGVMIWPDGRKYEGYWIGGKRQDKGEYTWPNGTRFEGMWDIEDINGSSKMFIKNSSTTTTLNLKKKVFSGEFLKGDSLFFSGPIKDGKPHGNGTLTDKHGSNYTGTFVNGVKSGFFTVDYSNNSRFEGFYKDNLKNGKGIYAEPGRTLGRTGCYVQWLDNQKYGKGLETLTSQILEKANIDFDILFKFNPYFGVVRGPSNDLDENLGVFYVGEFKNGLYHGHGVYIDTYLDLQTYDGEWRNGKRDGKGVETWKRLNVSEPILKYEGEYKNGMQHGNGVETWSNTICSYNSPGIQWPFEPAVEECTEHVGEKGKYEGEFKKGYKYGRGVQIWPDGQKYEGWLLNGTQQGVMTWPDGRKYVGGFKSTGRERFKMGPWLMLSPEYRGKYKGEWIKNGEGVMIWPDGRRFKGEWKSNDIELEAFLKQQKAKLTNKVKDGWKFEEDCFCMDDDDYYIHDSTYRKEDEDGKLVEYLTGKYLLGKGLMTWPDGSSYNGEWKTKKCHSWIKCSDKEENEGNRHGNGVMVWDNGRTYKGDWVTDQMKGNGVMIWPDGTKYEGEWSEGKRNGKGVLTLPYGETYDGMWKNDEMNGLGEMIMKN